MVQCVNGPILFWPELVGLKDNHSGYCTEMDVLKTVILNKIDIPDYILEFGNYR